jgi:hypothetical protein
LIITNLQLFLEVEDGMLRFLVIGLILTVMLAGCSTTPVQPVDQQTVTENPTNTIPVTVEPTLPVMSYQGVGLDGLEQYAASFVVSMQTAKPWTYQLTLRRSGDVREFVLHLEGVDPARNPGDIRLVSDGVTSRMLGEGTDNLCMQYPADMPGAPVFLLPDDLIVPAELAAQLAAAAVEEQDGGQLLRQAAANAALTGWEDVQAEVLTSLQNEQVKQLSVTAQGKDVLFGTGEGSLKAEYTLESTEPQQIEPIAGCEVSLPLIDDAASLIIMPGMVSFETALSMDETLAFYTGALEEQGWLKYDTTKSSQDSSVMSYRRGAESLEITISALASGCRVQLSTF